MKLKDICELYGINPPPIELAATDKSFKAYVLKELGKKSKHRNGIAFMTPEVESSVDTVDPID